MSKVAIATVSTPNRRSIYEPTNRTKERFCDLNGMDFLFSDSFKEEIGWEGHDYWLKVLFIQKHLKDYDAILYMDDDAGFVKMLPDIKEELYDLPTEPVLYAWDEEGPNSGVIIVQNTLEGRYFSDWWAEAAKRKEYQHGLFDQEAFVEFVGDHPDFCHGLDGQVWNAHHPSFKRLLRCPNLYDEERTAIVHVAGGPDRKEELLKSGEYGRIFG